MGALLLPSGAVAASPSTSIVLVDLQMAPDDVERRKGGGAQGGCPPSSSPAVAAPPPPLYQCTRYEVDLPPRHAMDVRHARGPMTAPEKDRPLLHTHTERRRRSPSSAVSCGDGGGEGAAGVVWLAGPRPETPPTSSSSFGSHSSPLATALLSNRSIVLLRWCAGQEDEAFVSSSSSSPLLPRGPLKKTPVGYVSMSSAIPLRSPSSFVPPSGSNIPPASPKSPTTHQEGGVAGPARVVVVQVLWSCASLLWIRYATHEVEVFHVDGEEEEEAAAKNTHATPSRCRPDDSREVDHSHATVASLEEGGVPTSPPPLPLHRSHKGPLTAVRVLAFSLLHPPSSSSSSSLDPKHDETVDKRHDPPTSKKEEANRFRTVSLPPHVPSTTPTFLHSALPQTSTVVMGVAAAASPTAAGACGHERGVVFAIHAPSKGGIVVCGEVQVGRTMSSSAFSFHFRSWVAWESYPDRLVDIAAMEGDGATPHHHYHHHPKSRPSSDGVLRLLGEKPNGVGYSTIVVRIPPLHAAAASSCGSGGGGSIPFVSPFSSVGGGGRPPPPPPMRGKEAGRVMRPASFLPFPSPLLSSSSAVDDRNRTWASAPTAEEKEVWPRMPTQGTSSPLSFDGEDGRGSFSSSCGTVASPWCPPPQEWARGWDSNILEAEADAMEEKTRKTNSHAPTSSLFTGPRSDAREGHRNGNGGGDGGGVAGWKGE